METMKVLTLQAAREMRMEERPIPKAGPNQLVCKIRYCGVCGSDIEFILGHIPPFLHMPFILGHENVGTVAEVGEGVTGFEVGDRIICAQPTYCAELCPSCKRGEPNNCIYAFPERTAGFSTLDGGYAEYLLVNDVKHTNIIHIPDNVSFEDAVLFDVVCVAILTRSGDPVSDWATTPSYRAPVPSGCP